MRPRSILLAALAAAPEMALAQEVGTVALVLGQRGSGFHQAIACGARSAADELGVEVEIQAAANYAATEQIPLLNSVLATGPAAVVLDPTSSTSLVAPLAEAASQGVVIVAVDTTVDDPSMLSAEIATDNFQVGVETAKALVGLLDGRTGAVAQVNSIPGISTVDARIAGFEDEIAKHPELTYIGNQFASEDVAQAQQAFGSLMSAHPDLVGVAAQSNNPAIGIAGGIRAAGVADQVVAVGVDADPPEIEALKEGLLDALVIQQPWEMGHQGVTQAVAALRGEPVTTPIGTGTVTATAETIGAPEVIRFLYEGDCM
ncbi:ribose ABC transporter, periplasmic binding protein [Rubellimicrobium mesophilum DSM 19309]|uniref:Ribose ABC transporter, periplasmic binding protein n=1 Tax=Rubellimicrobium mesophilum DSM 19309 TaxID=442562 RepID=A0A017HP97_9RHOB|nr:ABC transporter substrate-binding protein [Rubellimicrobium mesophilum]EYD75564.1 ribose ABC transporter, periplasmic binding protein [Rubellimicrobium mesophilum DSM 19309]